HENIPRKMPRWSSQLALLKRRGTGIFCFASAELGPDALSSPTPDFMIDHVTQQTTQNPIPGEQLSTRFMFIAGPVNTDPCLSCHFAMIPRTTDLERHPEHVE